MNGRNHQSHFGTKWKAFQAVQGAKVLQLSLLICCPLLGQFNMQSFDLLVQRELDS